ncbi:MAG: NADH-quinone oxidoreductase subunit NuoG [Candidatus Zixiibacteriota bacterium]
MITISINDIELKTEQGKTILEAAKSAGIDIPSFCWHEKLDLYGGCRLCLVEVDDMPKLQPACATYVCQGMKVKTNSPKVVKARKGVLEFLLINHPLDCPTCDKAGECELQDQVFKYGSAFTRFKEEKRKYRVDPQSTFDDLEIGPQIIRNMNRCILCTRCIRFIRDIAGEYKLGEFNRGSKSEINALPDIPIINQYAGNVTELCPVGALTSRAFRYKIRVWLTQKKESICPFCGDGCNITLWEKDGQIYRTTSRINDKVDQGFLCDRGRFGYGFVNHPQRLKNPLIKKGDEFVRIDWEEALETIASKFKKIKEDSGSDSFAGLGSSSLTNEDNFIFQKFFREVIETNNIDHRADTKNPLPSPSISDLRNLYGMFNSIEDIEKAKVILVLGCDMNTEHPILALRIRKAIKENNAKLILLNPRKTKLCNVASDELLYKYGTEIALINGILHMIIEEKLYPQEKISDQEIKELSEWIKSYDVDKVSQITGISSEKIKELAKTLSQADSLVILSGREIIQHHQNKDVIDSVFNLLALIQKSGKRESGFNLLWEDNNSQGALDMGILPDRLPGFVEVKEKKGLNFIQILEAINQGKIKAMYIMGSDPVGFFPDRGYVESTLKKLEFLVVQDIFLTETVKLADVILPGASFAEKNGIFTSSERRIQKLKRAFKPLDDSKADWEIISQLVNWMDHEFNYQTSEDITKEILKIYSSLSEIDEIKLEGEGIQWEVKNLSLKEKFKKADYQPLPEDEEYPMILMTGNTYHHFGSLTQRSENINIIEKEGLCLINPDDAKGMNIKSGDLIIVESPKGKVEVKTKIDEDIQEGTLFIPLNFEEIQVNILMDRDKPVDRVRINKVKSRE